MVAVSTGCKRGLTGPLREAIGRLSGSADAALLAGYRGMAEDAERERDAADWSEGLIADAHVPAR